MRYLLRSGLLVVAVSLLASLPVCAQQNPTPDPLQSISNGATPTLKLSTQLRVLDVTVVDRNGNPVIQGLTKEDFRVFDGKHERNILSFEAVNVAAAATVPPRTIIIVDHLNSTWDQETWEQKKVREFFSKREAQLPLETELVLLNKEGIQICQGFTRDRDELIAATAQIEPRIPYRLTGSWAIENFELEMTALDEIALQVKASPGRKNVLYLGTGGPGINMVGQAASVQDKVNAYVRRSSDNLLDSRVTLYVIAPEIQVGDTRNPFGGAPEGSVADGAGGGAPIGSADQQLASNITGFDPFSGSINLGLVANTTGGKLFVNRNDIDTEFEEAQALGSRYYTLSYKPEAFERDGKFVPIKVTLRPPGLHVFTKSGYYTLKDGALIDPELQARYDIRRAAQAAIPYRDIDVAAHGVRRNGKDRTVEFAVTLRPNQLTWTQALDGSYVGSIDVAAVSVEGSGERELLASNAKVVAVKSSTLAGSHMAESKLPVSISVRVPRRTSHVRIVVRDIASNKIGAIDIDRKTADATPEVASTGPVTLPAGLLSNRR